MSDRQRPHLLTCLIAPREELYHCCIVNCDSENKAHSALMLQAALVVTASSAVSCTVKTVLSLTALSFTEAITKGQQLNIEAQLNKPSIACEWTLHKHAAIVVSWRLARCAMPLAAPAHTRCLRYSMQLGMLACYVLHTLWCMN